MYANMKTPFRAVEPVVLVLWGPVLLPSCPALVCPAPLPLVWVLRLALGEGRVALTATPPSGLPARDKSKEKEAIHCHNGALRGMGNT